MRTEKIEELKKDLAGMMYLNRTVLEYDNKAMEDGITAETLKNYPIVFVSEGRTYAPIKDPIVTISSDDVDNLLSKILEISNIENASFGVDFLELYSKYTEQLIEAKLDDCFDSYENDNLVLDPFNYILDYIKDTYICENCGYDTRLSGVDITYSNTMFYNDAGWYSYEEGIEASCCNCNEESNMEFDIKVDID